jgi:hypothetical protein
VEVLAHRHVPAALRVAHKVAGPAEPLVPGVQVAIANQTR